VKVPLASRDAPFVFNELSADFQAVTVQGTLTYRVSDPRRGGFAWLDFSIADRPRPLSCSGRSPQKSWSSAWFHASQVMLRSGP
jgi:hypothetical protein